MEQKNPRGELLYARNEQTDDLISTKLAPPRLSAPFVPREALLARLDEGLDQKLTLVSAPAGFGKTTVVSEWMAARDEDNRSQPIAWVALDAGDNDPVRFWRYVLTAFRVVEPNPGQSALAFLRNAPQPPFEVILTLFINELAQLSNRSVLVLEDYHVITAPLIHQTLTFLIEHLPPALHLILITRSDPPLPLARLRARNELNELRLTDLRFTHEETRTFLQQAVPFPLSPAVITRLAERTEGWAAGLRLVALALQGMKNQPEIEQYLTGFTGSHRPILDYLVADVFNAQPIEIQEFLLKTSILSRLNGPLCNAVTGRDDSDLILEQLDRANLFLVPLDNTGEWYRYHALFTEAMQHYARQRLGKPGQQALALKASRWYEEHGFIAEAIEASLDAQDYPRAADLIQQIIAPRLVQNEFHTLRRWMEKLPEAVLRTHPELCLTFATAILFTSNRHSPETKMRLQLPLQIAEQHWQQEENAEKLGEVLAFRSLVAWLQREFQESFSFARQALELLPPQDRQWRGISLIMLAVDEAMEGRLNAARQTITEALKLCEAAENIYGTLDSLLLLGEVCYQQGELHLAEQIFKQVLSRAENAPMDQDQSAVRRGRAMLGLCALSFEWNDLAKAEETGSQSLSTAEQYPDEDLLTDSPIVLAKVKFARGEIAQAQQLLGSLTPRKNQFLLFRFPHVVQAWFSLASGDLISAERWVSAAALEDKDVSPVQREQEALITARLRMAQGESAKAVHLLNDWLAEAQTNGRKRSELKIRILFAAARATMGDQKQAGQDLIQALALAQPEGYRRIFVDDGEKLAALLRDTLPDVHDERLSAYARAVLYAMAEDQTRKGDTSQLTRPVVEPLSEQEQRVLRLIAAGRSNLEIAGELVISINTVKTHIRNIYGKLGVSSREDARQTARHLKLT